MIPGAEGRGLARGVRRPEIEQHLVRGVERRRLRADGSARDRPELLGVGLRGRVYLPGLAQPTSQPQAQPGDLAVALEGIPRELKPACGRITFSQVRQYVLGAFNRLA